MCCIQTYSSLYLLLSIQHKTMIRTLQKKESTKPPAYILNHSTNKNQFSFSSTIHSNSMHSSSVQTLWITMLVIIFFLTNKTQSNPRIYDAGFFCGTNPPPPNITYIPLFVVGMERLSQRLTNHNWGYASANVSINSTHDFWIHTLAQCYSDLSHNDCLQCFAESRTRIPHCLPAVSGRIFLDGCFLRYDSYAFYKDSEDAVLDAVNCNSTVENVGAVGVGFDRTVGELVDNLMNNAVANEGYAVNGSKSLGVYGLAECWNTLSPERCRTCLEKANREIRTCLPGREGRALNAGCYLRYSTVKFYSNETRERDRNSGISRTGAKVAIVLCLVAFCMLSAFACYTAHGRWKLKKQARSNLGQITITYNKSNLNFKYETLEKATNYFDPTRKLGQGGAGTVYKGILSNGKVVAVKRLFFSTRQWVDEFFNEVNLISGIEHKNLVKLLGCSIEGPESLLVYEFMPNMSLENHLFDKSNVRFLNWKERYNVIVGTAEGIAFLHGGSAIRIIHRDIKSSNVLLDKNFDARIADFGLARCFAADKTHLSTGIAGTLGYMAPEYIVKGQLTEKADVYSFGVVVIEIVCGRRNNAFIDDTGSLLQTVWRLYKTDRLIYSFDPSLKSDFPESEVMKVLKIGLLCTQASVAERPSIVSVTRMLTEETFGIPEPNQPPFLSIGSSTRSTYSVNSSASNAVMKPLVFSYASTESSSVSSFDGQPRSEDLRRVQSGNITK